MNTNYLDRTQGLGGSDIPALLGISPFKSPFGLYLEKTGELDCVEERSQEARRVLGMGSVLEGFAIKQFEEEYGIQITRRQERIVCDKYNFLWGTIDGVCQNSIFEVKTTSSLCKDWKGGVPMYVLVQAAYYAKLINAAGFKILALFRDTGTMNVYDFARDSDLENEIISSAVQFWEQVQNRVPPEPTIYSELQKRFEGIVADKKIIATPSDIQNLARMRVLKNEIVEKEKEYEELKIHICKMLGDAPAITDENGNVLAVWAQRSSTRVSMELLKSKFQNVYDECKVSAVTRNFCLKEPKCD